MSVPGERGFERAPAMSQPSRPRGEWRTAADLAAALGGRVRGDAARTVNGLAGLDEAEAHDVSFLQTAEHAAAYARTQAGIVLVSRDDAPAQPPAAAG